MLTLLSLHAQTLIQELTIDFDNSDQGLVTVLTGNGDCDANPGIFGIMDGAFVINDMEGATCCSNSPSQGINDNRALIGPVIALSTYCDVTITIDVSLSATDFESCLSRDISPIGCTAFIPTFDPGGDGFQLETMYNGVSILNSGYCGQQDNGIFTANIGEVNIGDVFTFLITGGTQDEEEVYSINSIEFRGRQRSFFAANISATDTVLCEGLDPLVLTEISGGTAYQWSKDGSTLASNTFSYNSGGVVSPSDEGLYRVTVTDAGGCITIDEVYVEVVSLSSKRLDPTFSNLQLSYCIGDTIILPSQSDDGVSGNWNITESFIINDINAVDSIIFTPNDILYNTVSFSIIVQYYVMATFTDTICAGATLILEGELFDSSRLQGTFIAEGGMLSCDTLFSVSLSLAKVDSAAFNQTVCPGDTFNIGGELFHLGRLTGGVLVLDDALCFTYVAVALTIGTIETTIEYDPCSDSLIFENVSLRKDTTYTINGNGLVCDSIINIIYQPTSIIDSFVTFLICPHDSVVFNNNVYDFESPNDTFIIYNEVGCSRDLIVHLDFIAELIIPYEIREICTNDTIHVGNELFYFGKQSGLVRSEGGGCDTLFQVDLELIQNLEESILVDPCIGNSGFLGIDITQDTTITIFGAGTQCDTIYNVLYSPSFIQDSLLQFTLCDQDSLLVEGTLYHASNASGTFEIFTENQCRRRVFVEVQFVSEIVEFVRDTICAGTDYFVGGQLFNADNPNGSIVYSDVQKCDSVLRIELEIITTIEQELILRICEGDTIIIQGMRLYSGVFLIEPIVYGPNGCDTALTIFPTYFPNSNSIIEMSFCSNEDLVVGGETFDASRPSGLVVIPLDNGCDSLVEVNLQYFSGDTIEVVRQLCDGQNIMVGGVAYNSNNPRGMEILVSISGCDSVVLIDLTFGSVLITQIEPLICPTEQIFIGNQFYDANNLNGTEQFTSSGGCDSIVEVSARLDTVEVEIIPKGSCRQSSAGTIEVTVLTQDTFEISLAGITFANPASSVIFEDLTIGEYTVVVESARGCFFVFPTEIEATFANEVSYTITDSGADFYTISVTVSGPFQSIIWEPSSDLSCIDCLTPIIRKGGDGDYRAVVQDLNGCLGVIEISIDEESQVFFYIPNVISANGDPDNRSFYLRATEEGILSYDMTIYDRWGQPMFENEQIPPNESSLGWQGLKNGSKASNGVYVYSILVRLDDGTEERRLGELLVIN